MGKSLGANVLFQPFRLLDCLYSIGGFTTNNETCSVQGRSDNSSQASYRIVITRHRHDLSGIAVGMVQAGITEAFVKSLYR